MEARERAALKRVFRDVVAGYSQINTNTRTLYLKHPLVEDEGVLDELYCNALKVAEERGLLSEKDALQAAIAAELWSEEQETEYQSLEKKIQNKEWDISQIKIEGVKNQLRKEINNLRGKQNELYKIRKQCIGRTQEDSAESAQTHHYLQALLYVGMDLKTPYLDNSSTHVHEKEISELYEAVNNCLSRLNLLNIQKVAALGSTQQFISLSDSNPHVFFGKPVVELSNYQRDLFLYGRFFNNVLAENRNIPEHERENPEFLIKLHRETQKDAASKNTTHSSKKPDKPMKGKELMAKEAGVTPSRKKSKVK